MNFRTLVLAISILFSLALSGLSYYYEREIPTFFFILIITFILTFGALNYVIQKFVYQRIRAVYKLIHNLKLGKELKDALGDHITEDPIADAEREVRDWAKQKTSEINQLRAQEKFRKEFLANISHELKRRCLPYKVISKHSKTDWWKKTPKWRLVSFKRLPAILTG